MTSTASGGGGTRLLAMKLHAPRRRRRVVPRARLTERRDDGHDHALTLVSAPAGFGKTTLLTEWFEAAQVPGSSSAAWLALDDCGRPRRRLNGVNAPRHSAKLQVKWPGAPSRGRAAHVGQTCGSGSLSAT